MDFFVYSRDAPGAEVLRDDAGLLEEHWSYMDGFADAMIARGPTLASDRETATGSLHVLGLPSVAAATEFVEQEPNNRAGVYAEHGLWVFENVLGRTMWDFTADAREPRFLVIAHAGHDQSTDETPSTARPPREQLQLACHAPEPARPIWPRRHLPLPGRFSIIASHLIRLWSFPWSQPRGIASMTHAYSSRSTIAIF